MNVVHALPSTKTGWDSNEVKKGMLVLTPCAVLASHLLRTFGPTYSDPELNKRSDLLPAGDFVRRTVARQLGEHA